MLAGPAARAEGSDPTPSPSAKKPTKLRVLVRIAAPLDASLYERTAGQVSDLDVSLLRDGSAPLEATVAERIARARVLSGRESADVVVWFEHPAEGETIVTMALPHAARVLVRRVASVDPAASSTSAMLEACSLVVRTALLALESGETLGVPDEEVMEEGARVPPPASVGPPRPSAPAPPRRRVVESARGSRSVAPPRVSLLAGAGWQVNVDGRSPAGARALVLEGGLARGAWSAWVRGSGGLPSRTHDEVASLEVSRHAAGVYLGYDLVERSHWQLQLASGGAVVLFRRSSAARDASFSPAAPVTRTSLAASLELRALWRPAPAFPVRLGISIGADALANAPLFSYRTETVEVRQASWSVEPRIAFVVLARP